MNERIVVCLHCLNVNLHQLFYLQIVIVTRQCIALQFNWEQLVLHLTNEPMNICLSRIEVRVLQYTWFRIHLLVQYTWFRIHLLAQYGGAHSHSLQTSQVIINSLILSNAHCEQSLHPARPRHREGDQGARVPSSIRFGRQLCNLTGESLQFIRSSWNAGRRNVRALAPFTWWNKGQ